IESMIGETERQIARDEGELQRYDELIAEQKQTKQMLEELRSQIEENNIERHVVQFKVNKFEDNKSQLDKITSDLQSIELIVVQKQEQEKNLQSEVEKAKRAVEVVESNRQGYETYQEVNEKLQKLESERIFRDKCRDEVATIEQKQAGIEASIKHVNNLLLQIEKYNIEIVTLTPLAEKQLEYEKKRLELQSKFAEKEQRERSLQKLARELDQLRAVYTETSQKIEEADRHRKAAEKVTQIEEDLRKAEQQLNFYNLQLKEIGHKQEQLNKVEELLKSNRNELTTLNSKIDGLRKQSWKGRTVAELETSHRKATEEVANLKAKIDQDRKFLESVKDGLCPLLSERCLNIKPEQSLADRCKSQISDYAEILSEKEDLQNNLSSQLQKARSAVSTQAILENLLDRSKRLEEDLDFQIREKTKLLNELNSLGKVIEISEAAEAVKNRIPAMRQELSAMRSASLKYAQLEPLRTRLEELKEEGLTKRKAYDNEKTHLSNFAILEIEKTEIENQLIKLGNPKATIEGLKRQILRELQLREELQHLQETSYTLLAEIASLKEQFKKWENLDKNLLYNQNLLSTTRNQYNLFITHQESALSFNLFQKELEKLTLELEAIKSNYSKKKEEQLRISEKYSAKEHLSARSTLEELLRKTGQLESDLRHTETKLASLNKQIATLDQVQQQYTQKIEYCSRLNQLKNLSDFIRDCLKKAGPYITEAYLHTISIEANLLYRDISGNSLVSLRWDNDYEIILEESGRDRPFKNLSGGEQMAAAISVRLALLKEFSELRFAFFDEPTTNMDEERRRNLAQQIGQIFIHRRQYLPILAYQT
ncbi:MAG: hypothetical protein JNN15_18765, partial [Blastocatellia bacterium]|nr:hypothetical protein [Blastocatellia bacterium]